jgi:multisubunit Na+/H+ antiporter MnhB subunit
MRTFLSVIILAGIGVLMVLAVAEMPAFGDEHSPAHQGIMERYLREAPADTGAVNVISAIILDYRAFDTLGEATVLFVAVVAVSSVLIIKLKEQEKS